jgi:hypothetical protein
MATRKELEAKCVEYGISFSQKKPMSWIRNRIRYAELEYKPVSECKYLVFGVACWEELNANFDIDTT